MFRVILLFFLLAHLGFTEVIKEIKTEEKVVFITLDACETKTPSYLDKRITDFLVREKVPFTLFVSGKFILRNWEELKELYKTGLISIQNHSFNHYLHMESLKEEEIIREVKETEQLIQALTGKKPIFFRFPAGNYDERALKIVESLGYKVVHWTFPSGDPDPRITPEKLTNWVLQNVRPGAILIFHANHRGYATPYALPRIIKALREKGYSFGRIEDYL